MKNRLPIGKAKFSNGREIEIDLNMSRENKPAYVRVLNKMPRKKPEAVIVPASRFTEFLRMCQEAQERIEEFEK